MAYIWNTSNCTTLPSSVYNLPSLEKEFVYQATLLRIKEENRAAREAKRKAGKGV